MGRHDHTTKLQGFIRELREWVASTPQCTNGGHGHRALNRIVADALDAVDDELAAIDAAVRETAAS